MNNLKMKGKNILYGTGLYLLSLWALYGKKIINIEEQPKPWDRIGKDDGGYTYRALSKAGRGESPYRRL